MWSLPTLNCNCYSDIFSGVAPALPLVTQTLTLTRVQARDGVPSVTIIQQPSTANDYNLIVEFNDTTGGAAWYIIQLDFPDQGDCNCYQISATEGAALYEDYWQACFYTDGTGSLHSANADHTYDLYLFSGGPGGYSTKEDSIGWSTWIALGSGPESTGYIWTPVFGTYLQAIGQHNGTRYSVRGIRVPCEPDL